MCKGSSHEFICLNCGRVGIPIFRKAGQEREQYHRKKLYCIWCKTEVNHIEVRNDYEKATIREAYDNGAFIEEAQESVIAIKEGR